MRKLLLGSAGLGMGLIGATYLVAPNLLLGVYGVELQSPSEANILRSGSGSLFLAMGILFFVGALRETCSKTSLVAMLTFMSGLAVGRLVSIAADGWPHPILNAVLLLEVSYAAAAAWTLRSPDARD